MTFLNQAMLLGLAAVAVPVLIHLLHRRRADAIDWGAMRFLRQSLASRRRRILLEEMLLMALRCLLVALLVLAAARPFLPSFARVPWAVVLPSILAAAVLLGVSAAAWRNRRLALGLLALAALLLLAAGGATAWEHLNQQGRARPSGATDVAVILDGSMSMRLAVDGRPNFERARRTARSVVEAARPGDGVCLVLAGPLPRAPVASPVTDRKELLDLLEALEPSRGRMNLVTALSLAATALENGQNPHKKIVIATDGQDVGWDLEREAGWQFAASALQQLPGRTEVLLRRLPLPGRWKNGAVTDLAFGRRIIGTDRPVEISIEVTNTGSLPIGPADLELSVDGEALPLRRVRGLGPGARRSLTFRHRFAETGRRVVAARLLSGDDLPADNRAERVVGVTRQLPVLLVDGAPSARPLEGAAAFLRVALSPGTEADSEAGRHGDLVRPTVVPAGDVAQVERFSDYRAVVLADVARLPDGPARRIARYVRDGGGLLITAGRRARPEFYNAWQVAGGRPLVPARLTERVENAEPPRRPVTDSFSHPALSLVADPDSSDVDSALVKAYWRLAVDSDHPDVRVGGRLDGGAPLLAERQVGKGRVLMTPFSLAREDTNLPLLKTFVPIAHEAVYYLSRRGGAGTNLEPGEQAFARVPLPAEPAAAGGEVTVQTPDGASRGGAVTVEADAWLCTFAGTGEPGLYRFRLPEALAGAAGRAALPFAVVRDPAESTLAALRPEDLARAGEFMSLTSVPTDADLAALLVGAEPGEEIWRVLAACALMVLLAEVAVARWITANRRAEAEAELEFGEEVERPEDLRERFVRQAAGKRGESA